jgi:hypothetical protein
MTVRFKVTVLETEPGRAERYHVRVRFNDDSVAIFPAYSLREAFVTVLERVHAHEAREAEQAPPAEAEQWERMDPIVEEVEEAPPKKCTACVDHGWVRNNETHEPYPCPLCYDLGKHGRGGKWVDAASNLFYYPQEGPEQWERMDPIVVPAGGFRGLLAKWDRSLRRELHRRGFL